MTIKELCDWAKGIGIENCELLQVIVVKPKGGLVVITNDEIAKMGEIGYGKEI